MYKFLYSKPELQPDDFATLTLPPPAGRLLVGLCSLVWIYSSFSKILILTFFFDTFSFEMRFSLFLNDHRLLMFYSGEIVILHSPELLISYAAAWFRIFIFVHSFSFLDLKSSLKDYLLDIRSTFTICLWKFLKNTFCHLISCWNTILFLNLIPSLIGHLPDIRTTFTIRLWKFLKNIFCCLATLLIYSFSPRILNLPNFCWPITSSLEVKNIGQFSTHHHL